jgi:hypothetical protein
MSKIKITSEQELEAVAKELLRLLVNVRHYTRVWEREYGSVAKGQRDLWNKKADDYLSTLSAGKDINNKQQSFDVKIEQP